MKTVTFAVIMVNILAAIIILVYQFESLAIGMLVGIINAAAIWWLSRGGRWK